MKTNSAVAELPLPRVVRATVTDDTLSADMEDGRTVSVPIGWFPRLTHGNASERANVQISGAGYGLHWPDLDEDISVDNLLAGKPSGESQDSLQRRMDKRGM